MTASPHLRRIFSHFLAHWSCRYKDCNSLAALLFCPHCRNAVHVGIQFRSGQSPPRLGCWGDIRDDSAAYLFRPFLRMAIMSSSGLGRDVHPLTLSLQHFLCRPRRHPPSKVPCRILLLLLKGCLSGTTFLNLSETQNLLLLSNPP